MKNVPDQPCSGVASAARVRPARVRDAVRIAEIYNHFIAETIVTFEDELVDGSEMERRRQQVETADLPWLVLEQQRHLLGYAYATKWRERRGYRYSCEVTIYLHHDGVGRGFGTLLYGALLEELRARGLRCVIGGIALPNPASVALHEKCGFEKVAHFSRVGVKFGRWIDVGYWQLEFSTSPQGGPSNRS